MTGVYGFVSLIVAQIAIIKVLIKFPKELRKIRKRKKECEKSDRVGFWITIIERSLCRRKIIGEIKYYIRLSLCSFMTCLDMPILFFFFWYNGGHEWWHFVIYGIWVLLWTPIVYIMQTGEKQQKKKSFSIANILSGLESEDQLYVINCNYYDTGVYQRAVVYSALADWGARYIRETWKELMSDEECMKKVEAVISKYCYN